ncbi:MAG: S9 family peptidase [Burkholderiaceae bacterium]|nr:S9 family peptidase [Burkholderiaceae bacterium]
MSNDTDFSLDRRQLMLAGAALSAAPMAWAQSAAQAAIPLQDFFRSEAIRGARLSPAGTHVVAIRPHNGRDNLVVFDLATRKTAIITNFNDADVGGVRWVNNDWLLLSLYEADRGGGDQVSGGMYSIRRDGSDYRELAERSFLSSGRRLLAYGARFKASVTDAEGRPTEEIIAEVPRAQGRGRFDAHLYRVNVSNGHFSQLDMVGAPAEVADWVLDRDQVPRAAVVVDNVGTTHLHVRDGAKSPWRRLLSYAVTDAGGAVTPVAFDRAGQLYVAANAGNDTQGIYTLDLASGKLSAEPVVAVKGFDLGENLLFSRGGQRLLGVSFEVDQPMTVWFDEAYDKLQAQIDKLLPGRVNDLSIAGLDAAGKAPVLVFTRADTDPGSYLLYDRGTQRLTPLGSRRPWIRPEQMRPTQFFRYDTPDGLSIPAQLTTPAGKGPFPLVVLHYGGPWVRAIHYGWDARVQFLVSRGYAVFMPAPRASTGFGQKLFRAGWKQWGLGMQDDVAVGVRKLIADGVADAKRVAITGASYGGYLTMMGLVKHPDLYRCGINWVGVTDPAFMHTVTWSDFSRADSGRFRLDLTLGDPEKDKAQFEQTSPLKRAAEIKQPVLMAYGAQDERVPIIHGERMRDALKPHNPNVEWVVYADEGHGFYKPANELDFWGRFERFLAKHLKA